MGHDAGANAGRARGPGAEGAPMPACPECGAETDTYFKNLHGDTVGCDVCIRASSAWLEDGEEF